jgi:thiol-disulfide isomerase/thioredoxin
MTEPVSHPSPSRRRLTIFAAFAGLGLLAGMAGIYGIVAFQRNAAVDPACRPAAQMAQRLTPLARGEVAALTPAKSPIRLSDLSFHDASGRERTIGEWRGRTVLLNLWATWCVPCRKEMPALDALETKLGGADFEVVAVNIDTRDPDKPKAWLKDANIAKLGYYADPSAKIFQNLKVAGRAFGMPTTILIDRDGCELATIAGPAEWASKDAIDFVQAALRK